MFRTSWLIFVVLDKKMEEKAGNSDDCGGPVFTRDKLLWRNREDFWEVAFGEVLATMLF